MALKCMSGFSENVQLVNRAAMPKEYYQLNQTNAGWKLQKTTGKTGKNRLETELARSW